MEGSRRTISGNLHVGLGRYLTTGDVNEAGRSHCRRRRGTGSTSSRASKIASEMRSHTSGCSVTDSGEKLLTHRFQVIRKGSQTCGDVILWYVTIDE